MIQETQKILDDHTIKITATTVRVPVMGGHSESVNIEFERDFDLKEVRSILQKEEGVKVLDNIAEKEYPTPLKAFGTNDVWVGRIRRDDSVQSGLNCWIVADNLRKGAATNTIQIAEYLIDHKLIN